MPSNAVPTGTAAAPLPAAGSPSDRADPLARFVDAQEGVFEGALAELAAGRKRGHWIWFVLPQLRGLGRSAMADAYGLAGRAEAAAYAAHPVLGPRLVACVEALLAHRDRGAVAVLGDVDATKLRSCLTLFAAVAPAEPVFGAALDALFGGTADPRTRALLDHDPPPPPRR
jgi:uncharacterized protein (DUF1810 family)